MNIDFVTCNYGFKWDLHFMILASERIHSLIDFHLWNIPFND